MKAPSKNITASIKGQNPAARGDEPVEVSGVTGGVSMTIPGDGSVDSAPGTPREGNRSAARFTEPMSRVK